VSSLASLHAGGIIPTLCVFGIESVLRCSVSKTVQSYACEVAPRVSPQTMTALVTAASALLPELVVFIPVIGPLTSLTQALCAGVVPNVADAVVIAGAFGEAMGALGPDAVEKIERAARTGGQTMTTFEQLGRAPIGAQNDPKAAAQGARDAARRAKEAAKQAAIERAKEEAKRKAREFAAANALARRGGRIVLQGAPPRDGSAPPPPSTSQPSSAGSLLFVGVGAVLGTLVAGPGVGTLLGAGAGAAFASRAA
jgi:hypothetical protein